MEDGMSDGQETESEAQTLDPIQEGQRLADVGRASLNCPGWICRVSSGVYSVLRDAEGGAWEKSQGFESEVQTTIYPVELSSAIPSTFTSSMHPPLTW